MCRNSAKNRHWGGLEVNLGLSGKVESVTAASKGIGKAVAEKLAKEKAKVSICPRGEENLQKTPERFADMDEEFRPPRPIVTKAEDV